MAAETLVRGQTHKQTCNRTLRLLDSIGRLGENQAYGQHSALSNMCDSGAPILYHETKSIPWVLSIPWVHVYTMSPCQYHIYTMCPCKLHDYIMSLSQSQLFWTSILVGWRSFFNGGLPRLVFTSFGRVGVTITSFSGKHVLIAAPALFKKTPS